MRCPSNQGTPSEAQYEHGSRENISMDISKSSLNINTGGDKLNASNTSGLQRLTQES